jgi:hypothetical protein
VVDLQTDPNYQALGVPVLSIAFDSLEEQAPAAQELGITTVPMLSDADHSVSAAYQVLQWAVGTGEPGAHVHPGRRRRRIAWMQDYAPTSRTHDVCAAGRIDGEGGERWGTGATSISNGD